MLHARYVIIIITPLIIIKDQRKENVYILLLHTYTGAYTQTHTEGFKYVHSLYQSHHVHI